MGITFEQFFPDRLDEADEVVVVDVWIYICWPLSSITVLTRKSIELDLEELWTKGPKVQLNYVPTTSNITGTLFFVFCFVSWLYLNLKTKRTTENRNLQEEPLLALPKSGGLCGSGWLASLLASTASQAATNMSRGFTYRIQQEDNKQ